VTGKDHGTAATGAAVSNRYVRSVSIVSTVEVKRMLSNARRLVRRIYIGRQTKISEEFCDIRLAGGFAAGRRSVLGRYSYQVPDDVEQPTCFPVDICRQV
jgi:hypothetical protein